jgi:hypothetical protein
MRKAKSKRFTAARRNLFDEGLQGWKHLENRNTFAYFSCFEK